MSEVAVVTDSTSYLAPGVAEQHGLELAVETPAGALWVDADATRLAQMIGNLLHNAGKFTRAGGQVTLALRRDHGWT